MSPLTSSDLQRIFEKLDMNEDGLVSLEELKWLLDKIGYYEFSPDELESFVGKKNLDLNGFLFFWESISKQNDDNRGPGDDVESDLAEAFKVFDLDGDGFITSPELECVLKKLHLWDDHYGRDCSAMICAYDTNSDGRLDFQEFKNMMLLASSS
ncbi:probable calcium-binding protein CML44 [Neltuma alba]|uniref:probable calcium-binding protein CML44 n=1 Tax=Neltuma alba TaxID=207710 RepID=UPI0010A367C9|nr:probable calcium-binding protein CML44 [Prosopis alba]